VADLEERNTRLVSYREHYARVRGRSFRGPGKPIHYVGTLQESAKRTRPRRRVAPLFWKRAQRVGPDGRPEKPAPMPDELKVEFTDAFWRSFAWQQTMWLGRRVPKCPFDLLAYQELITSVQPDWVVETNTGGGGRAIFLASICDLIGRGKVLSIDTNPTEKLPVHPRLTYLSGDWATAAVAEQVHELLGESPNALVLLGLASRKRLVRAFEAYASLVPKGSYVVFEDTIMNGNPVWPGMGPGPAEAVKEIHRKRGDFAADPGPERFGLTFNRGGYLKRMS
jgi:cephalosporin hydroxylase